jgi:hypothetical protein
VKKVRDYDHDHEDDYTLDDHDDHDDDGVIYSIIQFIIKVLREYVFEKVI